MDGIGPLYSFFIIVTDWCKILKLGSVLVVIPTKLSQQIILVLIYKYIIIFTFDFIYSTCQQCLPTSKKGIPPISHFPATNVAVYKDNYSVKDNNTQKFTRLSHNVNFNASLLANNIFIFIFLWLYYNSVTRKY